MSELKDLQGKHYLSGWDSTIQEDGCDGVCFILDDKKYQIYLDEDDGYRSFCRDLEEDQNVGCCGQFDKIPVLCIHKYQHRWNEDDIIEIYDCNNGKLIARIGTENTDDYYPCGIIEWNPQNIYIKGGTR